MMPRISVIVPVWNGATEIGRCLDALQAQDYPQELYEVIVVDNGSVDGTRAIVESYQGVTLLIEPAPGSYKARNLGLAHARGDYLAFTDADCTPSKNWLRAGLLCALQNDNIGVVGGRIQLYDAGDSDPVCRVYENVFSFNQEMYLAKGHCATANWISPAELIRGMGGFDGNLLSGGDFELSRRISAAGHAMVYSPDMVVSHPFRGGFIELAAKRRRTTGGQWMVLRGALQRARYVIAVVWSSLMDVSVLWRRTELPVGVKARIIPIIVRLATAQLREVLRLSLGGRPRRA